MRPFYFISGITALTLAMIGAFLPIMPTVPFLLLAAFCFARSNPAWEAKILAHPVWGPQVQDWRDRRAISRKSKIIAITAMAVGTGFTWFTLGAPYVYVSAGVLLVCGTWIATRAE